MMTVRKRKQRIFFGFQKNIVLALAVAECWLLNIFVFNLEFGLQENKNIACQVPLPLNRKFFFEYIEGILNLNAQKCDIF